MSNHALDLRLGSAVQDVSCINQFNWCRFVFQELYVALVERVRLEEGVGGLGHGELSKVEFPISRQNTSITGVHGRRSIVVDLPDYIRTDEEVNVAAVDDVHELFLLNERDADLFYKRYMDRMKLIKVKMQSRSEMFADKVEDVHDDVRNAEVVKDNVEVPLNEKEDNLVASVIGSDVFITAESPSRTEMGDLENEVGASEEPMKADTADLRKEVGASEETSRAETTDLGVDCGSIDPNMFVLSTTMINKKSVFDQMLSLQKQVVDYCFLDDNNLSKYERFVTWGINTFIDREDMESIVPGKMIASPVIEWWTLLLNDVCIRGTPSRLFFELAQMANIMGAFLVDNEVMKGAEIKDFELVKILFSWQTFTHENLDCGVFTMFHMLFYCGSLFECHLANEDLRALYRAEIAAILVLSDLIESRYDVLKILKHFGIEKEKTVASLVEKMKQAEQSGRS
ncbi:hypothetical protein RND81_02G182000 [Saponaria officinalis]|uniref:Uncharacterized protein n=1 Tax=Saponaria officinalis TaxID=3572 RepID=A0AAW1MVB5_SAPOF